MYFIIQASQSPAKGSASTGIPISQLQGAIFFKSFIGGIAQMLSALFTQDNYLPFSFLQSYN